MAPATFTLHATYHKPDGTPQVQTRPVHIYVTGTKVVKDTAGNVIISGRVEADVVDGVLNVPGLPDPRDPSLNPTGFGYTVSAAFRDNHPPAVSFGGEALDAYLSGGVLELAKVTTPDPSTFSPTATYVETTDLAPYALTADVPTTAADVGAEPAGSVAAEVTRADAAYASKKKATQGGQYLAPVRVPSLSVVESWPSPAAPFDRLMWTENAGATIYAYGRDRSVRKSTDSGRTWTRKGTAPAALSSVFWKTTAGSLLAFRYDYNNIYRSTDDGANWTSVHTLPFKQLLGAQSICQDLVTGYLYYAEYPTLTGLTSPTCKLWRSTNDGATWTEFYSFPTSGTGAIDHIHTIQWDHVAQRVVISAGDSNPAAGLYRINAAGTGVEPMVLHSNLPAEDLGIPRSIGIIPTTDYIVWAADTGAVPWLCRMHRSQIGLANPVVEKVYRLNSSAWWACKASDNGSRWVICASGENPTYRIDSVSHLYAVEDQGATVYEIGTLRARKEDTVTLAPVGAPGNHGDVFFMQTHTDSEPGTWKFALGLGSGVAIPWPQRIQVPLTKTVNTGPVSLAPGAEVVFATDFVAYRAPELHLFDIGAGGSVAGAKCIVRVGGVDQITVGNASERNARSAEWGASFISYALTGGASVQIVIKNTGASTVSDATAFCTYGWGSGVGSV